MLKLGQEGEGRQRSVGMILGVMGRWFTSLLVQHHHRVDSSLFTLETRSHTRCKLQRSGGAFQNKSMSLKQLQLIF